MKASITTRESVTCHFPFCQSLLPTSSPSSFPPASFSSLLSPFLPVYLFPLRLPSSCLSVFLTYFLSLFACLSISSTSPSFSFLFLCISLLFVSLPSCHFFLSSLLGLISTSRVFLPVTLSSPCLLPLSSCQFCLPTRFSSRLFLCPSCPFPSVKFSFLMYVFLSVYLHVPSRLSICLLTRVFLSVFSFYLFALRVPSCLTICLPFRLACLFSFFSSLSLPACLFACLSSRLARTYPSGTHCKGVRLLPSFNHSRSCHVKIY